MCCTCLNLVLSSSGFLFTPHLPLLRAPQPSMPLKDRLIEPCLAFSPLVLCALRLFSMRHCSECPFFTAVELRERFSSPWLSHSWLDTNNMAVCHMQELLMQHGRALTPARGTAKRAVLRPALQSLSRTLTQMHEDLSVSASSNMYLLDYLVSVPAAKPQGA